MKYTIFTVTVVVYILDRYHVRLLGFIKYIYSNINMKYNKFIFHIYVKLQIILLVSIVFTYI